MQAAVRVAMRDLRRQMGPDRPIYMVGYSNGAALAVDYTVSVVEGADLPRPAGLVLLSPAIGIRTLAVVARMRTGLSSLPGFGRAAWQQIVQEFDPYKYSSFSFNAAGQTQRLTSGLSRRVERLAGRQADRGLPAGARVPVDGRRDRQGGGRGRRAARASRARPPRTRAVRRESSRRCAGAAGERIPGPLTRKAARDADADLRADGDHECQRRDGPDEGIACRAGIVEPDVATARALPGRGTCSRCRTWRCRSRPTIRCTATCRSATCNHVQLGRVQMHGENGVLAMPDWVLTRQRSNPFHSYMIERIDGFLGPAVVQPTPAG